MRWRSSRGPASGSPVSGSRTPARTASSCAQNAMPRNSAIEVRYAHSSSAITPVSGPYVEPNDPLVCTYSDSA